MRTNKRVIILVLVLLAVLAGFEICRAETRYSYQDFKTMVSELQRDWLVSSGGTFHTVKDREYALAQLDKKKWWRFDEARNFVLSMNISWRSASETPNSYNSGCGLVFREVDTRNYLQASVNMDGFIRVSGRREKSFPDYGKYYYGKFSLEATHNLTIVANEENIKILLDGRLLANIREVLNNRTGSVGFCVWSGTNKDYGTWCGFSDINYYIW